MTCIVALRDESGKVVMGSDTLVSNASHRNHISTSKVFRCGPLLIGSSGRTAICNAIKYGFKAPAHPRGLPNDAYVLDVVLRELRAFVKELGYELNDDSSLLIGFRGVFYQLSLSGGGFVLADDYAAIGSGRDHAEGSLFSTAIVAMEPRERVMLALRAAEKFTPSVAGPFHIFNEGEL